MGLCTYLYKSVDFVNLVLCGAPYTCISFEDIITNQALVAVIIHLYTGRLVSMKVAYEGLCIYVDIYIRRSTL